MTLLKKDGIDASYSLSQIVVGTEVGYIYIIDQSGSKIIFKYKIPTIPYIIVTSGCFDIDYTLHIAGRDNLIYNIRQGELSTLIIDIPVKIFGMLKTDRSLIIGCIDSTIHSYHILGKKNFSYKLPSSLCCMENLDIKTFPVFRGYMLGLKNGEFRIYNEKNLNFIFKFPEPLISMKYGRYSTLNECMIFITESGGLHVKKLKMNVNIEVLFYFFLCKIIFIKKNN